MRIKSETTLKKEAEKSAKWRGHSMIWEGNAGTCEHCGAWVQVLNRPQANEIEIGGSAVAVNCLNKWE